MAAEDCLGPQFGDSPDLGKTVPFDPSGNVWGGSAMKYRKGSPSGKVRNTSSDQANMFGRHRAADIEAKIPTGSTTDFRAPMKDPLWKFLPNNHGYQNGSWN